MDVAATMPRPKYDVAYRAPLLKILEIIPAAVLWNNGFND